MDVISVRGIKSSATQRRLTSISKSIQDAELTHGPMMLSADSELCEIKINLGVIIGSRNTTSISNPPMQS